jgi:hypothetical protein
MREPCQDLHIPMGPVPLKQLFPEVNRAKPLHRLTFIWAQILLPVVACTFRVPLYVAVQLVKEFSCLQRQQVHRVALAGNGPGSKPCMGSRGSEICPMDVRKAV